MNKYVFSFFIFFFIFGYKIFNIDLYECEALGFNYKPIIISFALYLLVFIIYKFIGYREEKKLKLFSINGSKILAVLLIPVTLVASLALFALIKKNFAEIELATIYALLSSILISLYVLKRTKKFKNKNLKINLGLLILNSFFLFLCSWFLLVCFQDLITLNPHGCQLDHSFPSINF